LEYLVYLLARGLEGLFCAIRSHERALALGRGLGRLAFVIARDRRRVTIENLTIAFGNELDPTGIRNLARRNFEHLGMMVIEFFRLRQWTQEELAQRLTIEGRLPFNFAWSPGGRATLYVLSHFGSFEVLAATNKFLGIKGKLIVTGMKNRFINDRMIFNRAGGGSGLEILPHKGVVKKCLESLQNGEMVYGLADQRGDDTRPIWVDYFGVKTLANGVFARFAIEGDAFAFPVSAVRLPGGKYKCVFGPEIPVQRTGRLMDDITATSQNFHNVFEQWLREYPEQGFWMHRKFKRKPKKKRPGK
jgi:KDO2-lipid IV(A) lauroyltransferase